MHAGPARGTGTEENPRTQQDEPIAVVGIAALYPAARGVADYWRLLTQGEQQAGESRLRTDLPAEPEGQGLGDIEIDVARFGIPPAQAASMARMQLLMLEAARQCLSDAGYAQRPLPSARTDVVTGTCFGLDRQYANAARVESSRYARSLEQALNAVGGSGAAVGSAAAEEFRSAALKRFGASPHDRIGEMASTIPARVAAAFRLRGRTLALEAADATSYLSVAHAMDSLRTGVTDTVLVLTGQCREGRLPPYALAAKGLLPAGAAGADASAPAALGEGVGALLLKRLSSASQDGDRVYAKLLDCTLRHDTRRGVFRYSASADRYREAAAESWRRVDRPRAAAQYLECTGNDPRLAAGACADAQDGAAPSVAVGSVRDRLGHTFANIGLAAVSKVALALHHRTIPPLRTAAWGEEPDAPGPSLRAPRDSEEWRPPPDGSPRRAAVSGASLTGGLCHLIMEEHREAAEPAATVTAVPASGRPRWRGNAPEPVAVVGFGGRFADTADAGAFWDVTLSGRDRIRPVPEALLERDLYHSPSALSLNRSYAEYGAPMEVPETPPAGLRIPPARFSELDATQRVGLTVAAELFARPGLSAGTLTGAGLVAVGSNLGLSRERHLNTALCPDLFEELVGSLDALAGWSGQELEPLLKSLREPNGGAQQLDSPGGLDGCLASGIAALVANEFGIAAVPVAVEAACASSLAAVDLAVSRLRTGSVDYALAGGVELPCNARDMVLCSALGLLSHEKITPFDESADGFSPGDGCALFLLKRYGDARRDGDPIHGLLRGVGASNDAKSLIAPDVAGQVRAMEQAFEQVDFGPEAVDYLESHGTGTRVGDQVEAAAVRQVYGQPGRRPLEIGSGKSFFGHTFAAAGAAGLLRTLLAMRSGTLPATTNLRSSPAGLELDRIPARISTHSRPWCTGPGRPRRAGVSSFGTGGINYHLLLEEYTDSHGL
ncbi:polyketide synthase [Streptomyces sp. AA1529]|uniref:beta-ketoacyl [acyl carrier protein] synthase domain-containing protein n=1 Tax=Streptomyces sp. AA1529 TaxID=1203257 RepID=UPI003D72A9B4